MVVQIRTEPLSDEDYDLLKANTWVHLPDGTERHMTKEEMQDRGWGRITAARDIYTGESKAEQRLSTPFFVARTG